MVAALGRLLGRDIPLRLLFEHPSLAAFAGNLDARHDGGHLLTIRDGDGAAPLFLVHGGEGEAGYARALAPHIDAHVPILAFSAPGLRKGEAIPAGIEEIAALYRDLILRRQPKGPYRIAGWSAGGTIAFEIAAQLGRQGHHVAFVAIIDTSADYFTLPPVPDTPARQLLAMMPDATPAAQHAADRSDIAALLALLHAARIIPPEICLLALLRRLAFRTAMTDMLRRYRPSPSAHPLTLIMAAEQPEQGHDLGWSRLVPPEHLTLRSVPGNHFSMMQGQNAQNIAHLIAHGLKGNGPIVA